MSNIILGVMIFCSILGGLDRINNNKFGLGEKFEMGIRQMGAFTISMVGIFTLAPVIANILKPLMIPIYQKFMIDPSLFMGSLLACDMGAYATSQSLSNDPKMISLFGLILSSTLGGTVSFNIPMAIGLIDENNFEYFSRGALAGIITVPIGILVGGLLLKIEIKNLIINLIPLVFISLFIAYMLYKHPSKTIKVFTYLGKFILDISIFGLLLSIIDFVFGIKIINGMLPLEEGLAVVAKISIILSGAYILIYFIERLLNKKLDDIEKRWGYNKSSTIGLFTSMVNAIPMFVLFDDMDDRGKVMNAAFSVSGAFIIGGQLAFVSTMENEIVPIFLISKMVAGLASMLLARYMIDKKQE